MTSRRIWREGPTVEIDADTPVLEKCLRDHVELLCSLGGWVREDLIIRCHDGEISLASSGKISSDTPLITIPNSCLVLVKQANLRLHGDEIDFDPARSSLRQDMARLLDVQCEIYNLTNKIRRTRSRLPKFFLHDDPVLLASLTNRHLANGGKAEPETLVHADVLDAFLSSRVLNSPDHGADGGPGRVLMSLIDYMDHDSGGGRYLRSEDKATFFVNEGRSRPGQDSCFVRYGPLDAQDFLVTHGFVDTSARFLRSASFQCPLDDVGMVRVDGEISIQNRTMTPAREFDLSWSIPKVAVGDDKALEISSLYIVPDEDRSALRRALTMALVLWRKELPPNKMAQLVRRLEEIVIERTSAYLVGLRDLAERSPNSLGRRQICDLVDFQTAKLAEYIVK
jgi:hypothetical protein